MGSVMELSIDGNNYSLKPMGLDIINRLESYMKSLEPPLKEEAAGIAVIAEVDPALAEKLFEKALQRRKSIPSDQVLEFMSSDVRGVAQTFYFMLQRDYPGAKVTSEQILAAMQKLAEEDAAKYEKLIQERNEASGLTKPENPTDAAATPQN